MCTSSRLPLQLTLKGGWKAEQRRLTAKKSCFLLLGFLSQNPWIPKEGISVNQRSPRSGLLVDGVPSGQTGS